MTALGRQGHSAADGPLRSRSVLSRIKWWDKPDDKPQDAGEPDITESHLAAQGDTEEWRKIEARNDRDLHGYRMRVQVCPRGCGYHERARRDLLARTGLRGRADLHMAYTFETTNCPNCGAQLVGRP